MKWSDKTIRPGPVCGIDPGVDGALAFLDVTDWTIEIVDVPKIKVIVNGKPRHHVDHVRLAEIITARRPWMIVTEHLWSRPGQDAKGLFSLGRYTGQVEMASSMLGCDLRQVTPQEWKSDLAVSSDKNLSRERAAQLMPCLAPTLTRKGDHDRGEAALLAFWGALKLGRMPKPIRLINPPAPPKRKKAA
ncbi:hypothetical protein KEU06_09315 [Pseudaminobacter sp. 19-2017]|uniref:Uncharacterized protein n=1 Tax=Pseudaminobacter soli (ex Zhang et al. 2022) TaxID=2831468 RepID=A0A942E0A8_9HYPH|nr:hypothetical protein [Pseudaminobacter soli]MBS3648803.1 hypothetical protein [Pseudaminobacter soli]